VAERAVATTVRNPFPGLRPFRTDEEHLFFGRERQVDRMIDKLAAHRFLAVVGTSGSGKSSLVNCGLRPALHRGYMARAGASWRMAQFRPGGDPVVALARALSERGVLFDDRSRDARETQALVEATLGLGSLGLVDIVEQARLAPGTQLLVVVDQFEELFRFRAVATAQTADAYGPGEDAVALVRLLLEARAQADVPIHVVLTMRSDFLGDCAQFQGLPEAINEGQYLVPRLTRQEIRAAITGPVGVAGAEIDPVLVTRVLNDVGDNPDQLSILQHALNRTWARWESQGQGQSALSLPHYEGVGGMAEALDRHAEKAFAEVQGAERQKLVERIFKALTDKGTDPRGIRRPTKLSALCAITGGTADEIRELIGVFRKPSRSFLMPPEPESLDGDPVIDISHESLMRVWQRLYKWADDEAQSTLVYQRLRDAAALHEAGRTNLWRDPDLSLALDWRSANSPTRAWADQYRGGFERAITFLDASREQQEAERVEADIERRWLSGWSYLPLAIVAVPFVIAQDVIADYAASFIKYADFGRFNDALSTVALWMSHLLAGMPAALAYMALAPYIKKRFREKALATYREEAERPPSQDKAGDEAPAVSLEIHGTVYASFARRLSAQIVDWLLCLLPVIVLVPLVFYGFVVLDSWMNDDLLVPLWLLSEFAAIVVIFWTYHVLTWTSKRQATPGMRLVGVFLADLSGQRLTRWRATGRFFARFLSYYTVGVGFLMQPWSERKQALHDRITGTVVLARPPRDAPETVQVESPATAQAA